MSMNKIPVKRHQRRRPETPSRLPFHEFTMHPAKVSDRVRLFKPEKVLRMIDDASLDEKEYEILNSYILGILLAMSAREEWLPVFDTAMADQRLTDADKRLIRLAVLEMQENELVLT